MKYITYWGGWKLPKRKAIRQTSDAHIDRGIERKLTAMFRKTGELRALKYNLVRTCIKANMSRVYKTCTDSSTQVIYKTNFLIFMPEKSSKQNDPMYKLLPSSVI